MGDEGLKLTEQEMEYISLFERMTETRAKDCIVDGDSVVFVVRNGDVGKAIGKEGANVERFERKTGTSVEVVEHSEVPEVFVANAFQPAAVEEVEIEETDEGTVARVEVDDEDKGLAIGVDGTNFDRAERLARRHHGVDEVVLI
ncbi:MAG: NusA-like transcription termination signal-binding factor [Halobacteria archaeon]|nr:NusA-like transcription termination signal-binding factor [Halobacteria archaeon]